MSGDGGCRSGGLTSKIIRSLVAVCSKLLTSLARLKLINSWLTASPFSPDVIRPRRRLRCRRKQGPIQFLEYNPVQSKSLGALHVPPRQGEIAPSSRPEAKPHPRRRPPPFPGDSCVRPGGLSEPPQRGCSVSPTTLSASVETTRQCRAACAGSPGNAAGRC